MLCTLSAWSANFVTNDTLYNWMYMGLSSALVDDLNVDLSDWRSEFWVRCFI